MCKINKKQNAHGVTFRSLWNLGQPRIQEGKAGAKYIQNGSKQIQTRLLVRFFLLLPLSVEDARARRKVDLNNYYYYYYYHYYYSCRCYYYFLFRGNYDLAAHVEGSRSACLFHKKKGIPLFPLFGYVWGCLFLVHENWLSPSQLNLLLGQSRPGNSRSFMNWLKSPLPVKSNLESFWKK